jgi:hypothetical protein
MRFFIEAFRRIYRIIYMKWKGGIWLCGTQIVTKEELKASDRIIKRKRIGR